MGCSACGSGANSRTLQTVIRTVAYQTITVECDYTLEQMVIWKEKLECLRRKNLFQETNTTKRKINFALGTVISVLNTGNPCRYQKKLDEINIIILTLIGLEQC